MLSKLGFLKGVFGSNQNDDRLYDSPITSQSDDSMDELMNDSDHGEGKHDEQKLTKKTKIQIVDETPEDLAKVRAICIKCGDDQTHYITEGETVLLNFVEKPTETSGSSEVVNIVSPEGFCLRCEIVEYPERFHGCAFCRKPLRNLFACTVCRIGFTEWVHEMIQPETVMLSKIRKQAAKIVSGVIQSGFIENREFLHNTHGEIFDVISFDGWPGFYAGVTNINAQYQKTSVFLPTWVVPNYLLIRNDLASAIGSIASIKSITKFKMFEDKLLEILKDNGIDLYSNLQINLMELCNDVVNPNELESRFRSIKPFDV